jgi:hypothetical protein
MNLLYLGIWVFQFAEGWGFHPNRAIFSQKPQAATWIDYPKGIQNLCTKSSPNMSP